MKTLTILSTQRLRLRTLNNDDAPFYLQLVNDPTFINNIRDKGIRTIFDAQTAIQTEHREVQEKMGFSLYLVERIEDSIPIGLCGLVKRSELTDIDIGYAFLPTFTGQGYATEAAKGVLQYAQFQLQLEKILAITSIVNPSSENLLKKLGFEFQKIIPWKLNDQVKLFSLTLSHTHLE